MLEGLELVEGMSKGPLLHTWADFTARLADYLDHVRRVETPVQILRQRGGAVTLTRRGMASERPVLLTIMSSTFTDGGRREVRAALESGGVVQITRWGVVDGVLEMVP